MYVEINGDGIRLNDVPNTEESKKFLGVRKGHEIKIMTSQFLFMASPTKFYHVTQIILQIWLCDQSLVTLAFLGEVIITPISEGFDQKNHFFLRSRLGSSSII